MDASAGRKLIAENDCELMPELRHEDERLNAALAVNRDVNQAVGIIMERHRIHRDRALDMLRDRARSERRKLRDVAVELLRATERSNFAVRLHSRDERQMHE
jgi:AmiR/NasT family two-component response regulator